jgi:hypothetical protein
MVVDAHVAGQQGPVGDHDAVADVKQSWATWQQAIRKQRLPMVVTPFFLSPWPGSR